MSNELEILKLIQTSPKDGLTKLFNSYGVKLLSFAIENWKLDEDDAWESIYKTLETIINTSQNYEFESESHFQNFLYKVYKNNIRQIYRKQKSLAEHIEFVPLNEALDYSDEESKDSTFEEGEGFFKSISHDSSRSHNSRLSLIEDALQSMNPDERELLLLRGQNFSYKEIAELLKIKDDQLKVKFHRAKKKLMRKVVELQKTDHGQ